MLEELEKLHEIILLARQKELFENKERLEQQILPLLNINTGQLPKIYAKDWPEIVDLFSKLGLSPWLYWKIKNAPTNPQILEKDLEKLKTGYYANLVVNLKKENIIAKISRTFEQAGIEVTVLKGPALAATVYPSPALRSYGDIDLLVLPENVIRARKILEDMSYKIMHKVFENLGKLEIEEGFSSTTSGKCLIDLHWGLHGFHGIVGEIKAEELFQQAIRLPHYSILNFSDNLIHAALHLFIHIEKHNIKHIFDVAFLANKLTSAQAWDKLITKTAQISCCWPVDYALKLAHCWTGVVLPDNFLSPEWQEKCQQEYLKWQHALLRQKSLFSWFKARWPRDLGIRENLQLLYSRLYNLKRNVNWFRNSKN